jgi:hypothetical protein
MAGIGYVYRFDHNEKSETLLKSLVTPDDPETSIKQLQKYEIFLDVREPHFIWYSDSIENLPAPWFYFWTCHVSVDSVDLHKVGLFDKKYDGCWDLKTMISDSGFMKVV